MKSKNIELHNNCTCDIRWRMFSGRKEPVPGLFCSNHDVFLDWLSTKDAYALIDSGVQEVPYTQRKKAKRKPKVKSKNKPKWKPNWIDRKSLGI